LVKREKGKVREEVEGRSRTKKSKSEESQSPRPENKSNTEAAHQRKTGPREECGQTPGFRLQGKLYLTLQGCSMRDK